MNRSGRIQAHLTPASVVLDEEIAKAIAASEDTTELLENLSNRALIKLQAYLAEAALRRFC